MILGVQDIYYNVTDMALAVDFYHRVLGMRWIDGDAWWTSLDCGGVRIGLHSTEGAPVPRVPREAHGAHAGATLTLRVADAAAARAQLEAAGAVILGELDAAWGHMVVFEDPDGNVLKLMQPKP